jgi:PhnB protein
MSKQVKPTPEGYHSVTPYLFVKNAAQAIAFYQRVFDAKEVMHHAQPDGKIMHAELTIGDSKIMLADECPQMNAHAPEKFGGSPISIHLYVNDVDHTVKQAVAAGAKIIREVADQFYGDRSGGITDPFGHSWYIATHIEDVSEEEMQKRMATFAKK